MYLNQDSATITLNAVDDVTLPGGQGAIQQWRIEERNKFVKLFVGAGCRYCYMPYVIIHIRRHFLPGRDILTQPLQFLIKGSSDFAVAIGVEQLGRKSMRLPGRHFKHLECGHVHLPRAILQQEKCQIHGIDVTHISLFCVASGCGISSTNAFNSATK